VTENGLFLGKFDFATYSSVELPLSAGDRGLLYTDGVSETNNPEGVEFGSERFRQFLAAEENGSANQLVDGLLKDVAQWSARGEGEDLDDDITMVAIHVTDTT
jgi:serine phosphatase RsbU (regulator of sigma subunit)